MRIWDPHFHIWDASPDSRSGHDGNQIAAVDGDPLYDLRRYESDLQLEGFEFTGGAFLEAVSVCFVEEDGAEYRRACLKEAEWVAKQQSSSPLDYVIAGTAPLEDPDVPELLEKLSECMGFRGIRQILNFEPSWPRNAQRGDLLDRPEWREGFARLEEHGLSYDLQLNPHQLLKAVRIVEAHPDVPIILNHLGSPAAGDLQHGGAVYWEGLAALADLDHAHLKISMLSYIDKDWNSRMPIIRETVHRALELFGADRCMFASNFPVEKIEGWSADRLYSEFLRLADHLDSSTRQLLFADNARRAYRAAGLDDG